ncbi:YfjI family protein [Rhodanobacter sp. C01]|uniref:YfjI family protein n=1 Tax=Rhodanobacter sp. C01 TaxID=1945856 RepID=UPI00143939A8|nr:YfjI family protein [Rhodanobacter sp. C01]
MSASHRLPSEVIDALPPVLSELVRQRSASRIFSYEMVLTTALLAMSAACMSRAVVEHHDGMVSPLMVYGIIVAESSIGKSPVFDELFKEILRHDKFGNLALDLATKRFARAMEYWKIKDNVLKNAIVKAMQLGEPDDHFCSDREAHEENKPEEPLRRICMIQGMSSVAFMKAMNGKRNRVILAHAEAKSIFDSEMMELIDLFCTFWDGKNSSSYESAVAKYVIDNPYLAILFVTQPIFFKQFIKRNRGAAAGSGFTARTLIAMATTTPIDSDVSLRAWKVSSAYHDRMVEALTEADIRFAANDVSQTILTLSPEAELLWDQEFKAIKREMEPGGRYVGIKPFAGKYMENATRIAGIFHFFFYSNSTIIQKETMRSAIDVAFFYLVEHKRIFDEDDGLTRTVEDAWLVLKHLYKKYWVKGSTQVLYNGALNGGPPSTRAGVRYFQPAIDHLMNKGYLTTGMCGRTKIIYLTLDAFRKLALKTFDSPIPEDFSQASPFIQSCNNQSESARATLSFFDFGLGASAGRQGDGTNGTGSTAGLS